MTHLPADRPLPSAAARRTLASAGAFWFIAAVTGQMIFAAYILAQYGRSAARGDLASWNDVLFNGLIKGDVLGNLLLMAHLMFQQATPRFAFGQIQLETVMKLLDLAPAQLPDFLDRVVQKRPVMRDDEHRLG